MMNDQLKIHRARWEEKRVPAHKSHRFLLENQVGKGKVQTWNNVQFFLKGNDDNKKMNTSWLRLTTDNLVQLQQKQKHILCNANGSNYKFLPVCKSLAHAIFADAACYCTMPCVLLSLSHWRQIVSWLTLIYTKWSIKWFKGNYKARTHTQMNLSTCLKSINRRVNSECCTRERSTRNFTHFLIKLLEGNQNNYL